MELTDRRIVYVTNTQSANAERIEQAVTRPLNQARVEYELVETPSPNADDNIEYIATKVRDGDRVIIASGDGVTNQTATAVEMTGYDIEIGALAGGGFNDIASTFTGSGEKALNPFRLLDSTVPTSDVYPLHVLLDYTYKRSAVLYFASGFCAIASELMDDEAIRETIKNTKHLKQLRMGLEATKRYLFGDQVPVMPPFVKTFDSSVISSENKTDITAINGPLMANILRNNRNWYAEDSFHSNELDARSLRRSMPFLGRAALNNLPFSRFELPGETNSSVRYDFEKPANLIWQVDGEVSHDTVEMLSITKAVKPLTFLKLTGN